MIGKNGGQFLSSTGTPADNHIMKTRKDRLFTQHKFTLCFDGGKEIF